MFAHIKAGVGTCRVLILVVAEMIIVQDFSTASHTF